ncbi:TolC family outer membrane protein [Thiomicrorhabdus cannonii]|uniref:TolC family outer membrane protein n=1 Tax=Thiomicrorhabdus cannonii TaxID=2748011 RepID=UPI0015BEF9E0|nr:TolC family outer membrane protein [Thiomicrorhabdus cannonii]
MKLNQPFGVMIFVAGFVWAPTLQAAPVTLLEAIKLTLGQNDDLAAKQAQLQADAESVNQAWAAVKPNVSFQYSRGYSEYSNSFSDKLDNHYNRGTLSMVQPLYSLKRFRNIDKAEVSVEAAELQFRLDEQTKTLELAEAFLDLSKYNKLLILSESELADHRLRLERLEAMLERGLATKMDLLEARARFDEINSFLVQNQNEVKIRQKRLEHLLGQPVESVVSLDETLWERARLILSRNDWPQSALQNALSVSVAERQYELARQEVGVQKAEHWPEVSLRLEAGETDSYETSIKDDRKVQLEMVVPLYQGGGTQSKVTAAQKMMLSREHLLNDRKRFIKVKLEEVLARLYGSMANILALQQSKASNEAYLEAAQKGMNYGLRGVFDVLEAKANLYSAQRQLTTEIYNNLMAQFEFLYLIGRLDANSVERYLKQPFTVENW